jgi:hypothetical protein
MKVKRKRTKIPLAVRRIKRGGPRVALEEVERRVAARAERNNRPKIQA